MADSDLHDAIRLAAAVLDGGPDSADTADLASAIIALAKTMLPRQPGSLPEGFMGITSDAIDHPAHYGGADNPFEAIKVIQGLGFTFELGNAFKYMARAGRKDGASAVDDLEKARWYLAEEIKQWRAGKRGPW